MTKSNVFMNDATFCAPNFLVSAASSVCVNGPLPVRSPTSFWASNAAGPPPAAISAPVNAKFGGARLMRALL